MYCAKCGNGDQTPDSYCRSCGTFLVDPAKGSSLISRVFGISDPEKQVTFTLVVDLVTAIVSALLIFFLMGYFDATRNITGRPTPPIVYFVYVFLGIVSVWQLLSFTVGTAYKKKLSESKQLPAAKADTVSAANTQRTLSPADTTNIVGTSVTEQTTKHLDHVTRKK